MKEAADATATSTDNEAEENRCLNGLRMIKICLVNYPYQVSTQVKKDLRLLAKHPRMKIQACALDLLRLLKDMANYERRKNKKQKVDHKVSRVQKKYKNETSNSRNEKIKVQDCDVLHAVEKYVSTTNMAKNNEKKQVSGILNAASSSLVAPSKQKTMTKSNDATRDRIRVTLQEALSSVSREADESIMDQVKACDPIRISVAVESALFQKWGCFVKVARSIKIKYRSLMFNLNDPKNPDFRRRVLLGEFKPDQIVNMRIEDMASDERKKEIENIRMKALFKSEHGQKRKATTNQFLCGKCGKRECTYYQMQTRSADEPMTTYVTCVSCNHHWKLH
ncbi:hypothetical protein QN277_000699 [Acacia crassicarpa]|uniref:Transcription elongation factor TFIIS n=1 Tax=Acacia crassicarpa TaxID=499986 RepID=A0AAE1N6R4_9FABA|nr:hypothetical protein QN277_000699 [Acacia crassicarpa]